MNGLLNIKLILNTIKQLLSKAIDGFNYCLCFILFAAFDDKEFNAQCQETIDDMLKKP